MTFPLPARTLLALALIAFAPGVASAQIAFGAAVNMPTPALAAFAKTWNAIDDYSATASVDEQTNDGKSSTKRKYSFKFRKPDFASADVVDGPGRGSGAVWRGGNQIRGHMGGLFSHLTRVIAIDDARAVSVRGDTIDMASFDYDLHDMLSTSGKLSEAGGPAGTTDVTLALARPTPGGVTKIVLELSNATHLPGRATAVRRRNGRQERVVDGCQDGARTQAGRLRGVSVLASSRYRR